MTMFKFYVLVSLPSVHLGPLCVLVAPGGGVAGVRDVLKKAPPVLGAAAPVRVTVQTPHHGLPGAAAGDALRGHLLTLGCDKTIKTNFRYF